MFAAFAAPPPLSNASAASRLPSSSRRRRGVSKEVSIPWLIQSRLPANPPVVKHPGNNWLQKPLARVRPLLEGWRNLIVTGLVLWHSVKSDAIRSPLNFWSASSLFSVWCRNCSGLQNRSALPECSYWCFAGGKWGLSGWPFWRYQSVCYPCQTCNNYAKRYPASTPHTRRTCLRVHYEGKHFILKKIFFPLLPVISSSEC